MIKKILILILILCISNVNCQTKITSLLKTINYGVPGYISIGGTGFIVGTPTIITIGGKSCLTPTCSNTTVCECLLYAELPNATYTYDVSVTQNSVNTTAKIFKYAEPTVTKSNLNGNSLVLTLENLPSIISGYQIQINDGTYITDVKSSLYSADESYIVFIIPQTTVGGAINITLLDPFGFTHVPIKITTVSTITSMSPNIFDLSGTLVTVTGNFIGKTATVIIGTTEIPVSITSNDTSCSFTFTTTSRYESPLSITLKNAAGKSFTADSTGKSFTFNYTPPVVTSTIQNQDKITISTSNTGTDKSQMVLKINSVATTITSFIGGTIIANIPHALPEGETTFLLTPGTFAPVEKKILIAPVITSITKPSWVGGTFTITGMFLKNSVVYFGTVLNDGYKNNKISCISNVSGESIECPINAGNGTIPLVIVNYKDNSNTTAGLVKNPIEGKYQNPPTQAPSQTPSQSDNPTDTPFPVDETDPPSSSSIKLITTYFSFISIIFLLIV